MVVGHVRRIEHEGGVSLQQRDPEIRGAVGPAPAPHAQVRVVVVDHADAQRENSISAYSGHQKPWTHCQAASAGSAAR